MWVDRFDRQWPNSHETLNQVVVNWEWCQVHNITFSCWAPPTWSQWESDKDTNTWKSSNGWILCRHLMVTVDNISHSLYVLRALVSITDITFVSVGRVYLDIFNRLIWQRMAGELASQEWQPHPVLRSYRLRFALESQVPLPSHHYLPGSLTIFVSRTNRPTRTMKCHACMFTIKVRLQPRLYLCPMIWSGTVKTEKLKTKQKETQKNKHQVDPFIHNENTKVRNIPSHHKYHTVSKCNT